MLCRGYSPVQEVPHGRPHHKFAELSAERRPVRQGTDLLYTQWDSDPQFSSGPGSFFAGWKDEDEGSLKSNRFAALAKEEVSQLPVQAESWCWSVEKDRISVKRLSFNLGPHHPTSSQMMLPSQPERNKLHLEPSCRRQGLSEGVRKGFKPKGIWFKPSFKPPPPRSTGGEGEDQSEPEHVWFSFSPPLNQRGVGLNPTETEGGLV